MKAIKKAIVASLFSATVFSGSSLTAQETAGASDVTLKAGADLVSSYILRGQQCAGASAQPSIGVNAYGISLGAWGSTDFDNVKNEFDLSLFYGVSGFSVGVTDYFFPTNGLQLNGNKGGYFKWDKDKTGHQVEATASFDCSSVAEKFPLKISWNTIFYGADKKANGDQRYSSYLELGYPVKVKDVQFDFAMGFTPWESQYEDTNSFNMVNFSVKGSKSIQITSSFALPVFAQAVVNPNSENAYIIFGVSF